MEIRIQNQAPSIRLPRAALQAIVAMAGAAVGLTGVHALVEAAGSSVPGWMPYVPFLAVSVAAFARGFRMAAMAVLAAIFVQLAGFFLVAVQAL